MKKACTVILVLFFISMQAMALNKQDYDIEPALGKNNPQIQRVYSYGHQLYRSTMSEMSMVSGGYFTIGTREGFEETEFDNNTTVTYGHPYAMTSFPLLNIDGTWGRFDELHNNLFDMVPELSGDTLFVSFVQESMITISFSMIAGAGGGEIVLTLSAVNLDDQAHQLGGGLVLDPSLSRYGDGQVIYSDTPMFNPGSIANMNTDPVLEIWERNTSPKGMGVRLTVNDLPSTVNVGNWEQIFTNPFAEMLEKYLYDTAVQILWSATEVLPGDTLIKSVTLDLLTPDFNSDLFLRWDCPGQLVLSDNVLFPDEIKTTVEGLSTNMYFVAPEIELLLDNPYELYGSGESYDWTLIGSHSYRNLTLHSREIYEDKIVKVRLIAMSNDAFVDSLVRYVKIPATPVSDEGLSISIDSLITSDFPDMQMIFSGEIEETGQKLLNLHPENVFLYENQQRIEQISLEKFSGGGGGLADIIFVLDVSVSMGNEINAVRNNLAEFADSLVVRGFDFKIGVVTFSTTVDLVLDLTDDVEYVKTELSKISLWGGTEDSPSALFRASQLSLREGSKRNIIWITDENYPEYNYTVEEIVDQMLLNNIVVHGVGPLNLQTEWFNPIVSPTGGTFFDINGNFRDILLKVSRMKSEDSYTLSFTSKANASGPVSLRLEVHYAGLGGQADTLFTPAANAVSHERLACFPNPFNPEITLQVQLDTHEQGMLDIYNVLGQRVRHFDLSHMSQPQIIWNATNDQGLPVGGGMYFIQFTRLERDGNMKKETRKVLYLK